MSEVNYNILFLKLQYNFSINPIQLYYNLFVKKNHQMYLILSIYQ